MQKSSREKIALVVFALLIVLSLVGLGWYMVAGHSWNVAATTIDDTVGEMDGYTAIVYEGTIDPETQEDDEVSEATDARETSTPSIALGSSSLVFDDEPAPVDIDALEADYLSKGAHVLTIDCADASLYREGTILKCGARRIGVMSAGDGVTQLEVASCMRAFADASVDFTVVITPDRWKVQRISGIDIVICTEAEEDAADAQATNNAFYVDAAQTGTASVILISPSNVVSSKVVTEQ